MTEEGVIFAAGCGKGSSLGRRDQRRFGGEPRLHPARLDLRRRSVRRGHRRPGHVKGIGVNAVGLLRARWRLHRWPFDGRPGQPREG